jgi:murein DD-endopeptidase MepM/ murein hydrolase activator NlpD
MGNLWEPGERDFFRNDRPKLWPLSYDRQQRANLRKIAGQTFSAILIFLVVWGIFQFEAPLMIQVQGKIRAWFTTDYDMEPVLKFLTGVGIWGDTLERAAFEVAKLPNIAEPLTVPVSGQIGIPFGWIVKADQSRFFHDGIAILAAEGAPIKAALGGTVSRLGNEEDLGRVVVVCSEGGVITRYAHCKEILVDLNDEVKAGQVIAKVGKTGKTAYSQLLFSISVKGQSVDPTQFFLPAASRL